MSPAIVHLFQNGSILTMDNKDQIAEALAFVEDTILAVGSATKVEEKIKEWLQNNSLTYDAVQRHDLNGKSIVPGFIDAHMHPVVYIYFKTQADLSRVRSRTELKQKLQAAAKDRATNEWVFGIDFMEDIFTDPAERHFPDYKVLDAMCDTHPLLVLRHDGHICGVNSLALKEIGITRENVKEKTPPTGEIRVDKEGNPLGIFVEGGTTLALDKLSVPSLEQFKKATQEFVHELASFGITACGGIIQLEEEGFLGKAGAMEYPLFQILLKEGIIPQDFVLYFNSRHPKKAHRATRQLAKLPGNDGKFPWIQVGGIKFFADGTFGAHTAALYKPFSDAPEMAGFLLQPPEELLKMFQEAHGLGFQIATHSIGDKSNATLVDLYCQLPNPSDHSESPNFYRHRIEHASMLTPESIKKAAEGNIVLSCQPSFINSEYTWLEGRLGKDRCPSVYPFRSILDAGVILAGGSDAPVESANVIAGLDACVNRRGFVPAESITFYEAISMYTRNAAFAIKQENIRGSLEPGKIADLVILDQNVVDLKPSHVPNLKILQTFHRGKLIFQSKVEDG
jgi:hypothetical protein